VRLGPPCPPGEQIRFRRTKSICSSWISSAAGVVGWDCVQDSGLAAVGQSSLELEDAWWRRCAQRDVVVAGRCRAGVTGEWGRSMWGEGLVVWDMVKGAVLCRLPLCIISRRINSVRHVSVS
jgi:hypothetical protein